MVKKSSVFFSVILFLSLFISLDLAYSKEITVLSVFHSPSCHKCLQAKQEIIPEIEKEYKDKLEIKYYDITDINNYKLLLALRDKYNKDLELSLPVFFAAGTLINGKGDTKGSLGLLVKSALATNNKEELLSDVDLTAHFNSFRPFAVMGAGLADGINPCAFTVIVFFVSYLALQGYRKRELIVIGSAFITAVFLTYLLLGLGILNFLYKLADFRILSKILNILIGAFSIILGLFAVYDYISFRKTKNAQKMILQLPQSIKNRIHSIVGLHYRKLKDAPLTAKPSLFKLVASAFVTGFLISILESICTGQLYLPTITFILKTAPFKLKAFLYLILYNFMFILPLFIIFALALFGVSSGQFAKFLEKHMTKIKIVMAAFFISLGAFLIWRA